MKFDVGEALLGAGEAALSTYKGQVDRDIMEEANLARERNIQNIRMEYDTYRAPSGMVDRNTGRTISNWEMEQGKFDPSTLEAATDYSTRKEEEGYTRAIKHQGQLAAAKRADEMSPDAIKYRANMAAEAAKIQESKTKQEIALKEAAAAAKVKAEAPAKRAEAEAKAAAAEQKQINTDYDDLSDTNASSLTELTAALNAEIKAQDPSAPLLTDKEVFTRMWREKKEPKETKAPKVASKREIADALDSGGDVSAFDEAQVTEVRNYMIDKGYLGKVKEEETPVAPTALGGNDPKPQMPDFGDVYSVHNRVGKRGVWDSPSKKNKEKTKALLEYNKKLKAWEQRQRDKRARERASQYAGRTR